MTGSFIVNIDVPDLIAAIAFYETGLGSGPQWKLFDNSVAEMEGAGGCIFLIEQPAGSTAVPGTSIARDYSAHWTPVHLDIAVSDSGRRGCAERSPPERVPRAGSPGMPFGDIAPMRDPFGHGFCLIAFSEIGYDAGVSG